jgi:hypothetical protein
MKRRGYEAKEIEQCEVRPSGRTKNDSACKAK